jgi:hypothetical protein
MVCGAFLYKIIGANIFLVTTTFMVLIAIVSGKLTGIEKKTAE